VTSSWHSPAGSRIRPGEVRPAWVPDSTGSTYHYFPGGKQQLVTEAIRWAGDTAGQLLERKLAAGPVAGLRAFLALWRKILTDSEFQAGCPVLAVSIEDPGADEQPLATAAETFAGWQILLTDSMCAHGADAAQARRLATQVVAAVEGAVALCRASRSATALEEVTDRLEPLVAAAVH